MSALPIGSGTPSMGTNIQPVETRWLHDSKSGQIAKVQNLVINNDDTMRDGSTLLIPSDHPWAKNKAASGEVCRSNRITLVAVVKDFYEIRAEIQQQRIKVLSEAAGNVAKKAAEVTSLAKTAQEPAEKAKLQQQQQSLQHLKSGLNKMKLGSEMIAQADAELLASKKRTDAAFERLKVLRQKRLAAKTGQTTTAATTNVTNG